MNWSAASRLVPMQVPTVVATSEPVPLTSRSAARSQKSRMPGALQDAAESQGADDQPHGVEHALHTATGQQVVEKPVATGTHVAGDQRRPDALAQGQGAAERVVAGQALHRFGLEDEGKDGTGQGAEYNSRVGGEAPVDEIQHQRQREQQVRADGKFPGQVLLQQADFLGLRCIATAQEGKSHQGDNEARDRCPQHVPDMRKEIDPGRGGGQVGGV
jgi:hypothetical protein